MAAIFLVTVILVVSLAIYVLQKHNFRYWAKRGIVNDEPYIIFGNLGKVRIMLMRHRPFIGIKHNTTRICLVFAIDLSTAVITEIKE